MDITHFSDGTIGYEADGRRFRINPDEKLSEHFTLREMLRSYYAETHEIINLPREPEALPALRTLCQKVLEPLRQLLGRAVLVSSGYRTECLNYCVGGSKNSQHRRGEAADIYCGDKREAQEVYNTIMEHFTFDQLILEHRERNNAWWVHVSYTERHQNRGQAFMKTV